jgi:hypothetical protein
VPFTLAHTVAAIPLRRPLGPLGVLAALVIGSATPDVPFYLPISLNRNATHSAMALLWFCLPVGALAYVLYDLVLDRPLHALMPEALQRRLVRIGRAARPPVWSPRVLVSLLVGAATHLVWDAFTHGGSAGVGEWIPAIETRLFTVSGYTAYVFSVLQHTSTALGTSLLAFWIWRWYRRAPQAEPALAGLTPGVRRRLLVSMLLAVVVAAGMAVALRPPARPDLRALQPVARRLVVTSFATLVACLTVYSIGWHWTHARSRTWGPPAGGPV